MLVKAQPEALSQVSIVVSETTRTRISHTSVIAITTGVLFLILSYLVMCWQGISEPRAVKPPTPREAYFSTGNEDDTHRCRNISMREDSFGFAITSVIRDCRWILVGDNLYNAMLRASRMFFAFFLLAVQIFLQLFLIAEILKLAANREIASIRDDYSQYEFAMHGSDPKHVYQTANGFYRGYSQYFNAANFKSLDKDTQEKVCNIPLSQDRYFFAIIFVWTLSCAQELRNTLEALWALILALPTIASMQNATQKMKTVHEDKDNEVLVVGLTRTVKMITTVFILMPRIIITAALLWLGCMWLAATTDFAELVLNAVALEFVLHLKDLFYLAIVPERSRQDVANTEIPPVSERMPADTWSFLGAFVWGLIALVWCWAYVYHLQGVLPDYHWDVRTVCHDWIEQNYKVTK